MPRTQFIENDYIAPPYISADVNFNKYGEIKDISEQVANYLLNVHDYAFRTVDGYEPPSIESDTDNAKTVKLRFLRNNHLTEYHSTGASFTKPGQVKLVGISEAEYLLDTHADKFELAESIPDDKSTIPAEESLKKNESEEVDYREVVLEALKTGEHRVGQLAESIGGIHHRNLQPVVDKLIEDGLVQVREGAVEGKNYTGKYYSLKS